MFMRLLAARFGTNMMTTDNLFAYARQTCDDTATHLHNAQYESAVSKLGWSYQTARDALRHLALFHTGLATFREYLRQINQRMVQMQATLSCQEVLGIPDTPDRDGISLKDNFEIMKREAIRLNQCYQLLHEGGQLVGSRVSTIAVMC